MHRDLNAQRKVFSNRLNCS